MSSSLESYFRLLSVDKSVDLSKISIEDDRARVPDDDFLWSCRRSRHPAFQSTRKIRNPFSSSVGISLENNTSWPQPPALESSRWESMPCRRPDTPRPRKEKIVGVNKTSMKQQRAPQRTFSGSKNNLIIKKEERITGIRKYSDERNTDRITLNTALKTKTALKIIPESCPKSPAPPKRRSSDTPSSLAVLSRVASETRKEAKNSQGKQQLRKQKQQSSPQKMAPPQRKLSDTTPRNTLLTLPI